MNQSILPSVTDIDWNIEVILASSDESQVLRPVVKIRLKTDHSENVEMEMDLEAFGEFRCKTAEAMKILNDLKDNKALK